ncbi:unnamed protein product, partial [Arabidopsis halleri]
NVCIVSVSPSESRGLLEHRSGCSRLCMVGVELRKNLVSYNSRPCVARLCLVSN